MPELRAAALLAFVTIWWVTEAAPLPVTAVLGVAISVGVGLARPGLVVEVLTDPVLALFTAACILGRVMRARGADHHLAAALLGHPWVRGSGLRTLWAFGLTAWCLAMWIGITACVALLCPVALAIARAADPDEPAASQRFATGLLLWLVYAASAGAMATPVGTPPNLVGLAMIRETLGRHLGFFEWMVWIAPLAAALLALRFALVVLLYPPPRLAGSRLRLPGPGAAPPWHQGWRADIGTLILLAGGIALGRVMFDTGLAASLARALGPASVQGPVLLAAVILVTIALSELASNTAAANMVVPVAAALAASQPGHGLQLALAATLAASLGFMLPVSTPGNAIIHATGRLRPGQMLFAGALVDALSAAALWAALRWLPGP